MSTSRAGRRKASPTRKQADAPAERGADAAATVDAALDRWSDATARELAAFGIGATASLLRSVQALQQAQLDAARQTERLHARAAEQLGSTTSVAELARLQFELATSDGEVALQSLSKMSELAGRQAMEAMSDTASGWAQLNSTAWAEALQWMSELAHAPSGLERVEAEVDHVMNPIAASPVVWPAQEAARQAMTLAASAWNDWLSWSGRWADAGRDAAGRAAVAATR